ncbi:hypothetical protein IX330_002286 [Bacteroides pyogenes]|uniref:hypothetical protein n=6 Tax=Bacteroides pyogenes TaxID=310300 RepID=UPI00201395C5|nr:hypothetical protein [Bacteroides pyogenes]MBR8721129.1 hypothetical protein [Bacteroides pyogenes]MBR8796714.1 hypothetical protein [Bacteroides pyogenes]MBR8810305.1 hypothetical protein [Bacteroides pyogenes]
MKIKTVFIALLKKNIACYRISILLCTLLLSTNVSFSQTKSNSIQQIGDLNNMFARIAETNAYVEDLNYNEEEAINLPIGMKRTIGGMEITIAISRFALQTSTTEIGVYAKAVIPQGADGKRTVLFFGAEGIKGTHTGGLTGELKLSLLHDVEIPFNGGNTKIVLKGKGLNKERGFSQSNTYMTIGCDGFHNLAMDAEVHFPTSLIVKAGGQNIERNETKHRLSTDDFDKENNSLNQVIGHFSTVIESWDDLLVSLNLPSFEIKGLKDYIFSLDNVILDFSSRRNSDITRFPQEYQQGYLPDEQALWRGVYAENVSVTLPNAFSRASFSAKGLLIDDYGITGLFAADSILSLDRGSADGWRFSVDHFGLNLIANELVSAEFSGKLGLPFKGKNTTLGYEGYLQPNNEYTLRVKNEEALDFSIFNAKAHLEKNSNITLRLVEDHFVPEAVLHGYMTLGKSEVDSISQTKFEKISFRSLKLTTVAPYISAEYFGYEGEAKLGNFPLSINKIALSNSDTKHVRLTIGAGLNLGQNLFSGATELSLLAKYEQNTWMFDKLEVGTVAVNSVIAGVIQMSGELNWHRGDAIYGYGFAGDVTLGFSFNGKIDEKAKGQTKHDTSIKARAAFGRKGDFRYWYADGMATFRPGVPIVGAMTLNGIGGALTSGVRAEGRNPNGGQFSNANYIPDSSMGFGFKAATVIEIGKAAYGEAAFEMIFSNAGGLASAGFYGYGEFPNRGGSNVPISEKLEKQQRTFPSELSEQFKQNDWTHLTEAIKSIPNAIKDMGLSGTLCIQMDFQNHVLHASSDVYLNTPSEFIRGVGERGKAGWGVLHIDPKEWYLHLGTPTNRLGVQLAVGNILAVKTGSYFMTGSRIPEMPAPPQAVADILGQDISRLSLGRNIDALSTGKGFAFGSELAVKTGDLQFLMMYANFNAGLGFDIMLKDYAQAQCKGRSGTIGMDGWYAQGQTYAYLQGELGVKVKLWFIRIRVPVIKGGAAALLQAGIPDPTFFKGYLGVNLNVLGLIKGKARFKLTIGEECDVIIPGSSPIEEPMINDLSPAEGEQEVNVFSVPQATFNVAMGKSFEATGEDGETVYYRISLKDFIVKDKNNQSIAGKLIWGKDKTDVRFQSKEILPPNTELTAEVRIVFEELRNGEWKQVLTSGKPAYEEKVCHFTTGGAPSDIPVQNIVYSYPVLGQKYLLTKEYDKGYVQLQFGQKYLFEKGFDYKLAFVTKQNERIVTDFNYNEAENRLEFTLPVLKRHTEYSLDLSYSAIQKGNADTSDKSPENLEANKDEYFSGHIGGNKANATISSALEQSILTYNFATSQYETFKDKMKGVKVREDVALDAGIALTLGAEVQSKESFDEVEVLGVEKTQYIPLLSLRSDLNEEYFTNTVIPLVYEGYPYGNIHLILREEQPIGVPPYKAFSPSMDYLSKMHTETVNLSNYRFPFVFDASLVSFKDYRDLQNSIINNQEAVIPQVYNRFVMGSLPVLKKGRYKATISYVLPDGTITSSANFIFTNQLNLNK